MPYCPKCQSEYQEGIEKCTECGVALVDTPPDRELAELVEVFRAETQPAAERVCTVILDGVETFIRERGSRAFPTTAMASGLIFIAVPSDQSEKALQLLVEAGEDGALTSDDGELLLPEGGEIVDDGEGAGGEPK